MKLWNLLRNKIFRKTITLVCVKSDNETEEEFQSRVWNYSQRLNDRHRALGGRGLKIKSIRISRENIKTLWENEDSQNALPPSRS